MLIIAGQEGTGKSTLTRALLPHVQLGAAIDAEDVGQVNPWHWDDAFKNLLWANVAAVARNFWVDERLGRATAHGMISARTSDWSRSDRAQCDP